MYHNVDYYKFDKSTCYEVQGINKRAVVATIEILKNDLEVAIIEAKTESGIKVYEAVRMESTDPFHEYVNDL